MSEVIIRTYSAGVHIGTIVSREGREIVLANARRLYSWSGAFTLNAVAMNGVNRVNSRISIAVPQITLLEAIEIIPVAPGVDLSTSGYGYGDDSGYGYGGGGGGGFGSGSGDGSGFGSGSGSRDSSGDGDGSSPGYGYGDGSGRG
jgi:hypothetical protein